jgi:processing peptidase subunit alpha
VPLNVAYTLLGNSSSFSSGGPGKGMHARTTKNMLNSTNYINSAACINSLFTDSGLFGLEAAGSYQDANKLVVKIA